MSRIKELINDPTNNISLIDLFELFVPEKKTKYVDLMVRIMKNTNDISTYSYDIRQDMLAKFPFIKEYDLTKIDDSAIVYYDAIMESLYDVDDLSSFHRFCEHNERGLIIQNDLSKYKDFDEITSQLSISDMRANEKEFEKQIRKIHEDNEWLILRPLTYESSKKYGANTKWCTAGETNENYFNKYSKNGILIYCVNKLSGYKVAVYKSLEEDGDAKISFWNQKDNKIDALDTELPIEMLGIIKSESIHNNVSNITFLSHEVKSKIDLKTGSIAEILRGMLGTNPCREINLTQPEDSEDEVLEEEEDSPVDQSNQNH